MLSMVLLRLIDHAISQAFPTLSSSLQSPLHIPYHFAKWVFTVLMVHFQQGKGVGWSRLASHWKGTKINCMKMLILLLYSTNVSTYSSLKRIWNNTNNWTMLNVSAGFFQADALWNLTHLPHIFGQCRIAKLLPFLGFQRFCLQILDIWMYGLATR